MKTIGDRLRWLREERADLSQREMADLLASHVMEDGCSHASVGHWERGMTSPRVYVVAWLCRRFSVSPTWVLLGEGPRRMGEGEPDAYELARRVQEAVEDSLS